MKKLYLLAIIVSVILLSCSPAQKPETYDITFSNTSSYLVFVRSVGDNFDTFSISPGESKTVEAESDIDIYSITGTTGDYIIDYTETDNTVTIYQYQYVVEYRIAGTASLVDVTLNNSSGGTEQYDDVALPHTYSYKTFADDFVYISAQNQGKTGTVTTSIYYKGKLFKESSSEGAYVIASASGSL